MRWTVLLLPALGALVSCKGAPARPDARLPGTGKLHVTSEPSGAMVLEEGERLGRTPLTLERRAMTRPSLEVIKDGYQTHRIRRLVEEGQTVRVHAAMQPEQGTLVVKSGIIRGATILVDGHERGATPQKVEVTAGRPHALEVRRFGLQPVRIDVTVSAGETREVDVELVPLGKRRGPGRSKTKP